MSADADESAITSTVCIVSTKKSSIYACVQLHSASNLSETSTALAKFTRKRIVCFRTVYMQSTEAISCRAAAITPCFPSNNSIFMFILCEWSLAVSVAVFVSPSAIFRLWCHRNKLFSIITTLIRFNVNVNRLLNSALIYRSVWVPSSLCWCGSLNELSFYRRIIMLFKRLYGLLYSKNITFSSIPYWMLRNLIYRHDVKRNILENTILKCSQHDIVTVFQITAES